MIKHYTEDDIFTQNWIDSHGFNTPKTIEVGNKYLHKNGSSGVTILDNETYFIDHEHCTRECYKVSGSMFSDKSYDIVPVNFLNLNDYKKVERFPWES